MVPSQRSRSRHISMMFNRMFLWDFYWMSEIVVQLQSECRTNRCLAVWWKGTELSLKSEEPETLALLVAWLHHVCLGLVLIRWSGVFVVWHCWLAFHSSLHGIQSERSQRDCCLFIHRAGNGWEQGSSDRALNTGTLQHIVPINTTRLLMQTYRMSLSLKTGGAFFPLNVC